VEESLSPRQGGIASEAELADACFTALARCFRQSGGCPGFQDIANILQTFARDQGVLPSLSAVGGATLSLVFEALGRTERQQGGHRGLE
jgi:hypothetical protein